VGNQFASYLARVSALALLFSACIPVLAQNKEKPTLKDFGSSLKQMKWDPGRKAAVEVKLRSTAKLGSEGLDVVKVETSLVTSDLMVLDAEGNPVAGLTENDFFIKEDGQPQQVGMFSLGNTATAPRSIVLIIDYGCSQLPFLGASIRAAKTLIDKLSPSDRVAIVTDDVELLIGFTADKKKLKEALDELIRRTSLNPVYRNYQLERFDRPQVPFGRGFQYSALMAVLREMFDEEDQRPVIIFQTDGSEAYLLRDPIVEHRVAPGLPSDLRAQEEATLKHFQQFLKHNPREFSINDVYKMAEQSRATIYTVTPGLRFIGLKPEERAAQMRAFLNRSMAGYDLSTYRKKLTDYLKRVPDETLAWDADEILKLQSALGVLSTVSGGWIEFLDSPAQAEEIYARILSDMNQRYVVGYYSTNKAHDGKRRKVTIMVRDHPEYMVMSQKGYYAPGPDQ
jgi:VWFA-related protein